MLRQFLVLSLSLLLIFCSVSAQERLTVAGVQPGMTYEQVIQQRGFPLSVAEEQGFVRFLYGPDDGMWFHQGKVAEVHGEWLEADHQVIAGGGRGLGALTDRLGRPEEIRPTMRNATHWWPGLRLGAWFHNSSSDEDEVFSLLLSGEHPYKYLSGTDPWANDQRGDFLLDGIRLGVQRGQLQDFDPERVEFSASGYVVRVRGDCLQDRSLVGYHTDFRRGDLRVNERPGNPILGPSKFKWDLPQSGVYQKRGLRVVMEGGLVKSLEMSLSDASLLKVLGAQAP